MFIPMKWVSAKKNVTTKELVNVNEYGISPTKFETKINKNRNIKIEKY
jgi:hypothetical protein